jgi:hypothetical protein
MDLNETLGEIVSAIDHELKTIKRHGATSRIALFSGQRSSREFSRAFLYRFEMLIQRTLPEGSRGKLTFRNKSVDADVVAVEGQFLWLSLARDMGERIPHASYDTDLSFILEDLKEKYSLAKSGSLLMGKPGVNLLLGRASNPRSNDLYVRHSDHYLSSEQRWAIEKTLSAELGAILGPHGTGKTRTLAGLLVECFASGERLLVCGYTNRAVDETLKAFKKAAISCVKEQFFAAHNSGRIVRKGTSVFPESETVIKDSNEVAESIKPELQRQLDEARRKIRETQAKLSELKTSAKKVETRDRIKAVLNSQHQTVGKLERDYQEVDNAVGRLDKQIQRKERCLDLFRSYTKKTQGSGMHHTFPR